jgi:hypothetical protein
VELSKIVAELDSQIARLKGARALLTDAAPTGKRRGRPPGKAINGPVRRKRNLTAEGRKRISEALKRRWALRRKSAGQKAKADWNRAGFFPPLLFRGYV